MNSLFHPDHIAALLKQAKDAVQAANKTVNNDITRLRTINRELDRIKIPSFGDSNVDNILNSINKTCEIPKIWEYEIYTKISYSNVIVKLLRAMYLIILSAYKVAYSPNFYLGNALTLYYYIVLL